MQHERAVSTMTNIMAKFTNYIGKHLPDDIMDKLRELRAAEISPLATVVYDSMFENLAKADELDRPCCQDTGVIPYFLKAGSNFPLLADVRVILDQATQIATQAAPLRQNTVEGCAVHKAVHAVFPGGCAVLAATRVEEIERVEWLDLGMPEALWVLRVKNFGPLIISIDTKGNNLFD